MTSLSRHEQACLMKLRFEILLPSSGNLNDYVKDIYIKHVELDRDNTTDKKKLRNVTNN